MKILVTGSAGFIGFYVTQALLKKNHEVIGLDNLNDYYDVDLKKARLSTLSQVCKESGLEKNYQFIEMDIADRAQVDDLFKTHQFDRVIHLAAQAGVRYSIENPHAYVDSNLVAFVNILEGCRQQKAAHLIYASSSSVYGMNTKIPFSTEDRVDYPISLYAATKKSNELMAHTYSHLYGIPTTGLRFFTVYGPWGRPDMAYFSFTKKILNGETIDVFNHGDMERDFTYIDDIVEGVVRVMDHVPEITHSEITAAEAPYKIYNIGNNQPIKLERFIKAIELATGKQAVKNNLPMQAGDVPRTYADVSDLMNDVDFKPETTIEEGINAFVDWYRDFYKV
ncbi:UDP-N-acetylglucosamine 4-epimerase [Hydrogenovibrio crunogenus]|uniref:UDP-N-acetylglucosamine 4-epimerase n=1 Tax=Hydrogenovibrio crunogenus TaxID=39765 RepID=A0A4P7P0T5_9GAMM|nr:NAD-dependent epimerase [Hydrogenovibrio crunogenus]QBZ83539.1 UDP-N-acetylglucosamine 4-epimerase [Hydrogenovibrio crunogenus]